jgi:hypothetical protein
MHVYKFKLISESHDDFLREIEIRANQTFDDLHNFILEEIGFDNSQLASFYLSNGNWDKLEEITLLDMSEDDEHKIKTMNMLLSDVIEDPHQRLIYVYDFINLWTFYLEIIKIIPASNSATYPRCTKRIGMPPKQILSPVAPSTIVPDDSIDDEFEIDEDVDYDENSNDDNNYDDYFNELSEGFEEIKI